MKIAQFGSPKEMPCIVPLMEEYEKLSPKDKHKVSSFIVKKNKLIKIFDEQINDHGLREYMYKHIRRDIISTTANLPESIHSFVRNLLLTKLKVVQQNTHKVKSGFKPGDIVGTVLFTDNPTYDKFVKTDVVMIRDRNSTLYNRVLLNRYGFQGFIQDGR
jgi:hypothetical protein